MLDFEEAKQGLREISVPIRETEKVTLIKAVGRVLAKDARASYAQPPFARSPLDGYALRGEDTKGAGTENPRKFRVIGKIYAGEEFSGEVAQGQAVRIMTGAPIPKGADTVIRQEESDLGKEWVEIYRESQPYENYCPKGEDYQKGDILLKKGTKLDGMAVSVLASLGIFEVEVYRKVKIAVISTGSEVISPGQELRPGKIYDANLYYLYGRLAQMNVTPVLWGHCEDEPGKMITMIKEAAQEADLIVTTGGVSVGEKDIMHEVIACLGAQKLFWRVEIKPGAPMLAAMYEGTLITCLSGNPYGAVVTFELLVREALEKMTMDGNWKLKKKSAILTNDYPKRGGVRRFLRGYQEEGYVRIVSGNQASGALSSILAANCLVEIKENCKGARKGEQVWTYLL